MSPSTVFWVDISISLLSGIAALAVLMLILSAGLRWRLNQVFGLFLVFAAMDGLTSAAADLTLWVDHVFGNTAGLGNPLFFMELSATAFYFLGCSLLIFAITYVETASPTDAPQNRRLKVLAGVGVVFGLVMLPWLFSAQIIERVYMDATDLRRWEITELGYVLAAIPLLFDLLALGLFWQNRRKLGTALPALGAVILFVGGLIGGLVRIPFPLLSFCLAADFVILGYVLANYQIFAPLRASTMRLEAIVDERTRELQLATNKLQRLNEQYRRVAEIGQEVARIATRQRQPERAMAERLVQLVHDRLGYHHVYVYRPDEANQHLRIEAAAGSNAQAVLLRKHRLQIGGRSLAGQAAAQHRTRVAEATGDDTVYFSDMALPGARSEIALPLLVGSRLLGVLDLQSINYGAFSEEDLSLMVNLADQFAAILDNARLLQETEAALAGVEEVQRQYLQQAWELMVGRGEGASAYLYTRGDGVEAANLESVWSPEIAKVAEEAQVQVDDAEETLALPIILRGQLIGALHLRHRMGRTWHTEDVEALSEVSQRLGLALETVRLSEESRRLAARERVIRQISDQMQRATDMQELLRVATEELSEALNASRAYVRLGTEAELIGGNAHELDQE